MAAGFSGKNNGNTRRGGPGRYTEETYAEYVKNLKSGKKGKYFSDSYLKFIIAVVIVAIGAVYFMRGKTVQPDTVLSVAIESDTIKDKDLDRFSEIIEDELNLDTEHEKVDIFCITEDTKLQELLNKGKTDIVISPEEKFNKWARAGYFTEPGDIEEFSFYNDFTEEQKYYLKKEETGTGEGSGKLYNYGIYLTGTDKYKKELWRYITTPVAGISLSSENTANAVLFLRYMIRD